MYTPASQEAVSVLLEAQSVDRIANLGIPSNAHEQKHGFLNGTIENPVFFRNSLTDFSQNNKIDLTARYRTALAKLAIPDQERTVLESFAESLDTEITLTEIAKEYAAAQISGSDTADLTAQFIALRTQIFGELPIDRYKQSVRHVLRRFGAAADKNEETAGYLEYINDRIGHSEAPALDTFLSNDSVARVEKAVKAFRLNPPVESPKAVITANHLAISMNRYLRSTLQASDWNAKIAPILEPASTDRFNKVVTIRNDLEVNEGSRAIELITHEGFHSYRAILARELGSVALLIGLPDSQNSEEGFATIFGKVYSGATSSLDSFDYPAFVTGIMDHEGYDFRGTFEIFWRALALIRYSSKNRVLHENAREESRELAYKILCSETRIFDQPRYRSLGNADGVKNAWKYLDEHHDDPHALETLLIGKHDPSNPEHKRFLHNII